MGIRTTEIENKVAIFDSVTDWAFGPVFDSEEDALSYIAFGERLGGRDLRLLTAGELEDVLKQWLAAREAGTDGV